MSKNEFQISRTAFANVTYPGHATATASTATGAYIPAGAIVTGVRLFPGGAVTLDVASNATVTPYVSNVALASNNNILSAVVVQTAANTLVLGSAEGVYIPAGAYVDVDFGSTHTDATGMTADFDMYIDYLYCPDHD